MSQPSSSVRQGLPEGCPPLPTAAVVLPMPFPVTSTVKIEHFHYQFFHHHPEVWVKYNADFNMNIKDIVRLYLAWSKMVKDRKRKAAGENKDHKVESTKERLHRKIQERVAHAEQAVRQEWHAIQRPASDDEKRMLPTSRVGHLARATLGQGVKLSPEAETALELLAQSFVADTVAFAVAMARRRPRERGKQNNEIRSGDAALFLSTAFNILLPMSAEREVKGYTVTTTLPKAKAAREIVAAARRENLRDTSAQQKK